MGKTKKKDKEPEWLKDWEFGKKMMKNYIVGYVEAMFEDEEK